MSPPPPTEPGTGPGHRRPIAARRLLVMGRITRALVQARISPNTISIAGMLAAIAAGFAFASAPEAWPLWLLGALLVQLRLLANLLDGMVAVAAGTSSSVGELFNEVPDRISDTAVLAGLGWAAELPALGIAAALAAMATAYVRALGRGLAGASDFRGPMAKQQRMAVATLVGVWCGTTPVPWATPAPELALWAILLLSLVTAARRLAGVAQSLRGGAIR